MRADDILCFNLPALFYSTVELHASLKPPRYPANIKKMLHPISVSRQTIADKQLQTSDSDVCSRYPHIGIQMNRKDMNKTLMMIAKKFRSSRVKPYSAGIDFSRQNDD